MVLEDRFEGGSEELTRNAMQSIAMSAIYDMLVAIRMKEAVNVEAILSSLCDCPYSEVDPFLKSIAILTLRNYHQIVDVFNSHMDRWTFDRLNLVEQAILILAYVHYCYVEPDTDRGVVINIAVKFAKTYCNDNDYKFVNAILDNVLPQREASGTDDDDDDDI